MRDILQAISDHPFAFAVLGLGIWMIVTGWRRR
jgi:hypothetical protein